MPPGTEVRDLILEVRSGHLEGPEPPKVGRSTLAKCPQRCDLGHAARDTAEVWFPALMSPEWGLGSAYRRRNGPTWAPAGPEGGPHGPKRSIRTSVDIQRAWGPLRVDHKGVWASFGISFGLFWAPETTLGHFEQLSGHCQEPAASLGPKGCQFDGRV